ncbi:TnsA endonuclease N-terminal domain-containing protein [Dongia sp.]|uniref:TnsA endonuclease N-terminal domain-containing protein n=1 Tax=Dongia sp. TaxID=1977262 RepID=UPI0037510940
MRKRISEERRIAQGRGSGYGSGYLPWLNIRDGSSSQGWTGTITGRKVGRDHTYLSKLEYYAIYLLQDDDEIIDIREQYPLLDKKETIEIAREKGITHPRNKDGRPVVMTTDFLVTFGSASNCHIALPVKQKKALEDEHVLEWLEIDRIYHQRRNHGWKLLTEDELDIPRAKNLSIFDEYWDYDKTKLTDLSIREIEYAAYELLKDSPEVPLRSICSDCDRHLALDDGATLATVQHLLARKQWKIDMRQPFEPEGILRGIARSSAAVGGTNA